MKRCFELASCGAGKVSPNPMVGAVIVHDYKIIGEGYHQQFGQSHAEVNAFDSVKIDDLDKLPDSAIYINLEPCSHYGKTPPCVDFIIEKGIKKICFSNRDPNPLLKEDGIGKLKKAGCEVETGILEDEGYLLNRRFFTFHKKKRPYIILKWAQSADGFFTKNRDGQHWITGPITKRLVHKWRSEEMAIMVGRNTAKVDNPSLTIREWSGKNPIRIVLDRQLQLSTALNIFNSESQTIVFTEKEMPSKANIEYIKVSFDDELLQSILTELYLRKINSIIIEGGAKLLHSFIEKNMWDEARVLIGKSYFGNGVLAPQVSGTIVVKDKIGDDKLVVIKPPIEDLKC